MIVVQRIAAFFRQDRFLAGILIVGMFLLFTNLGGVYLWEDEATSALLGRSTLREGIPKAWDGTNIIEIVSSEEYNDDFVWMEQSWLPFYLIAGSFFVFGENEFAARLPSALIGLLTVYLLYSFVHRVFSDRPMARFSAVLLVVSPLYLLHMRQCSYYALVPFSVIGVVYSYTEAAYKNLFRPFRFIFFALVLFHSFYPFFFPVMLAVVFDTIMRKDRKLAFFLLTTSLVIALFTIPWFLYAKPYTRVGGGTFTHISSTVRSYVLYLLEYIIPLPLLLCLPFVWMRKSAGRVIFDPVFRFLLLIVIFSYTILLIEFPLGPRFRYMIGVMPICYVFLGGLLSLVWRKKRVAGYILLGLLAGSNILHVAHQFIIRPYPIMQDSKIVFVDQKPRVYSYLVDFVFDLFHHRPDPNECIDRVLKEYGRPGEIVKTNHGGQPIIFYTDMVVVPQTRMLSDERIPDWIVMRGKNDHLASIINAVPYKKIITNCPEVPFGNNPDPSYYHYRDHYDDFPRLMIYRRIKEGE